MSFTNIHAHKNHLTKQSPPLAFWAEAPQRSNMSDYIYMLVQARTCPPPSMPMSLHSELWPSESFLSTLVFHIALRSAFGCTFGKCWCRLGERGEA